MKTIYFALALALPLCADTISYFQSAAFGPVSDYSLNMSGAFGIPRFDTSLGTLTAVQYSINVNGNALFAVLSRPSTSMFTDDGDWMSLSFLGDSRNFTNSTYGFGYYGDANDIWSGPCGTSVVFHSPVGDLPEPCPDVLIPLSRGGAFMERTASDFGSFIGSGPVSLPWSLAITLMPPDSFNPGVVFGGHTLKGEVDANLSYVYTPSPVTITATPEPRLGFFLAGIILAAWLVNNHVHAAKLARQRVK